ncbi:MAG: hypothetical protein EOP83_03940 [Verrucomicrobiaceae bacterium]|nr:MAG: hypothetical protein EOP83_03940 [Verrucomicrobiaceae bacterium]
MWFRRLMPLFIICFAISAFCCCAFGIYMESKDGFALVCVTVFFGFAVFSCYLWGYDTPMDDYRAETAYTRYYRNAKYDS